ncbi:hypothetical protein [Brevundimonas sp.]|uniref:hypothetical protein n=1 Tax=Brevundimonas sp. TaxID=1871086 RepID=UPI002897D55D|nr:hypothetical protein [Brevundimonas sp.]
MALQKTIHGKVVTHDAFKRTIVEAITKMQDGAASMADLLPVVGPEWDTAAGRKLLGKTLVNMASGGPLRRSPDTPGIYTVSPGFKRRGVSVADQIEQSVVDSIRKRGGFAKFAEIMDDHGLRPHGDDLKELRAIRTRSHFGTEKPSDAWDRPFDVQNTTGYHQIRHVLSTSEKVRQDFVFTGASGPTTGGWYNLPMDELNQMVLPGQFAGLIVRATHEDLQLRGSYMVERDNLFSRVGAVFNAARRARRWSREEFVGRKRIAAALLDLAQNPAIARENTSYFQAATESEAEKMVEANAAKADIAAYRETRRQQRGGVEMLVNMLERFEEGGEGLVGVNMHMCASVSFYKALASELGIDPVGASRGFLQLDPRDARVTVQRPQADMDRLVQIEVFRQRQREDQGKARRAQLFDADGTEIIMN